MDIKPRKHPHLIDEKSTQNRGNIDATLIENRQDFLEVEFKMNIVL